MQEVLLSWQVLSVTGRDRNCNGYTSFGKTPHTLSQSRNFSGHLARGFCSPVSSPGSAVRRACYGEAGVSDLPEALLRCVLLQLPLTFLSPWGTWRSRSGSE